MLLIRNKWILLLCLFLIYSSSYSKSTELKCTVNLENGFKTPPESVQTAVFWYWVNNNISCEGAVKDLQAMKKAGINRVFIGTDIRNRTSFSRDLTGQKFGKVKVFSDEWWNVLHVALKTASELNIQVGLFNCPGWSQSGGPWIKPKQAMRYLESTEMHVKGPDKLNIQLAEPDTFFQDVKVLAIPISGKYNQNLLLLPGTKIIPVNFQINNSSGQPKFVFPEKKAVMTIELPGVFTARSLALYPGEYLNMKVEVQTADSNEYKSVQTFNVTRSRTADDLSKGFEPYVPFFISLGELKGKSFRFIFTNTGNSTSYVNNIVLNPAPALNNLTEKKLARIPGGLPSWNNMMWNPQAEISSGVEVPQANQVSDISSFMSGDGFIKWNVPPGEWIIMRTGMRFIDVRNGPASFEAEGLEVDKMNKKHIESHFNAFIGEILKRIPAGDRKTLNTVVLDSYERGGQNFTDGFLDDFKRQYGYDAVPFLPVYNGLVIGNIEQSERFLWDMRRLVADKIAYDYVGGLTEISNKYGLKTWLENYGHSGFASEFLLYGGQSDEISGEFWYRPVNDRYYESRSAASAAHTYGKKNVWAESFTSGSWDKYASYECYPQKLKRVGDWAYTEGVNSTLLHVYIQQPYENDYPGVDAWFGTEFNRKNTWFSQLDLFTLYHKRCNFMLQQGLNMADVAYFIGEDVPKMTGIRKPELPKGYNYDFINADVIMNNLKVKDGKLILPSGTTYRILVLPPQQTMRPELLSKIGQLVSDGAVIIGPPPSRSPSLQDYPCADKQVQEIAAKLWGTNNQKFRRYGKGLIMNDVSLMEAFHSIGVKPDCITDNPFVRYTHRSTEHSEIYFLANLGDKAADFNATFRVDSLQPELWDAMSGTARLLPAFKQTKGQTTVPLHLGADESAFIVFRTQGKPVSGELSDNFPVLKEVLTIKSPWEIQFEHDAVKRGPAVPVVITELMDWTHFDDDRIKYFSGTAIYNTSFNYKKMKEIRSIYLDLGDLSAMAKVRLNNRYIGGVWTLPYRLDVTKFIKNGKNTLEIEVVNTWVNRLIGDKELPEELRKVHSDNDQLKANSPLQRSGLFGPVKLIGGN
ncbi:MAG: glycosyl hydrolase [Paludibacteraceae bacterium]